MAIRSLIRENGKRWMLGAAYWPCMGSYIVVQLTSFSALAKTRTIVDAFVATVALGLACGHYRWLHQSAQSRRALWLSHIALAAALALLISWSLKNNGVPSTGFDVWTVWLSWPILLASVIYIQGARQDFFQSTLPFVPASHMTPQRATASILTRTFTAKPGSRVFGDIHGMVEVKTRIKKAAQEIIGGSKQSGAGQRANRNGILLSGAPGNGKTVFVDALSGELRIPYISVTYGDVASKWVNETTENVVRAFRDAEAQAPCILFLDEIDSLISRREGPSNENESGRTTNAILTELVNIRGKNVIVMGATNFLDRLDAAAIREGRFDYKIEIPPPDNVARFGLLIESFEQNLPGISYDTETARRASDRWEGYSVKRIQSVGEELAEMYREEQFGDISLDLIFVALRRVQGRKGRIPPDTKDLDELILPAELRQQLKTIAKRMKDIERVEKLGGTVPSGLLMFGAPGTGKTETARSLAKATGWAFLHTSGNDLIMNPSSMDTLIADAADIRPCIVCIDEADDILADRRQSGVTSVTNKLLAAMDGAQGKVRDVVYVAATNHPENMDPAALRGGRFTEKMYFPLPDEAGLATFVQSWMDNSRAEFDPSLSAATVARSIGHQVTIANAAAVLQEAVNTMIGRSNDTNARVQMGDIQLAAKTVLGD
jgi:transitional endoplasmic reticulum ATPase